MPDLLAGTVVKAQDFYPTVQDEQAATFSLTNTSYGVGSTGGTYADCGVAFTAPTSGRVMLFYNMRSWNGTAGAECDLAPVVREGSTVGSGTTFLAATDDNAIRNTSDAANADDRYGASMLVEGLTPGSAYNVRMEHKVSGGSGNIGSRNVVVQSAP